MKQKVLKDTEVADSNGYGSDLFNMKKEAVSEYPKEEIKSEAPKGMLTKEKTKSYFK